MDTKADRTKRFIIERTAPVFNSKGYAGTSLNDMMDVTGLSKGSIYGNFENKDAVALAAFDHNFGMVAAYIKNKIEERGTYIDKLLVYPDTYRNFLKLPFLNNGCPIANTSTEADDTHPQLRLKAIEALQLWRGSVERLIRKGIESGEIAPATDIQETVAILVGLIQGSVIHAKLTGKTMQLNAAMNYLERMIKELAK